MPAVLPRLSAFIAIVLAGLGLSACGGGDGPPPAPHVRSWGAPVQLFDAGEVLQPDSIETDLAVGPNGQAFAVWSRPAAGGGNGQVWVRRYADGAWGAPEQLSDDGAEANSPRLAVDGSGNALVVWSHRVCCSGPRSIQARRYDAGARSWGTAMQIDAGVAWAETAQVAFDASGNAQAVWLQASDGEGRPPYSVWARRLTAGGAWGARTRLDHGADTAASLQLAVGADGTTTAVWQQSGPGGPSIWANRLAVGGGWGVAARLDAGSAYVSEPHIAVGAHGEATALWTAFDLIARNSVWASRYAGGAWGAPAQVDGGAQELWSARIASDAGGAATVVWDRSDGGTAGIRASRNAGAAWDASVSLDDGTGDAMRPQAVVDADGNPVAVWFQYGDTGNTVRVRRHAAGMWEASHAIGLGMAQVEKAPRIAIDASGNATVLWLQESRGPGMTLLKSIWAVRYE